MLGITAANSKQNTKSSHRLPSIVSMTAIWANGYGYGALIDKRVRSNSPQQRLNVDDKNAVIFSPGVLCAFS